MYEWGTEDPCTREDQSDFQTYSNNSATTKLHLGPVKVDLKMLSHLKTDDDKITQIYEFYTSKASQNDVYLILDSHDIQIAGDKNNDFLKVKRITGEDEYYNLSSTQEVWLNSTDYQPFYFITDIIENKNILNEWPNNNYEWKIRVNKNVSLYINLGEFNNKETKYFEKQWVDAGCACTGFGDLTSTSDYPDGTNFSVGETFTFKCKSHLQGVGTCSGCVVEFLHNQYDVYGEFIPTTANSSDILECDATGTYCQEKLQNYSGDYRNVTIECKQSGTVGTWCIHEEVGGWNELPSGNEDITCSILSESEARQAIEEGLNNSVLNLSTVITNQQVYIRYLNNDQSLDSFDKFISEGNQTWMFNYISINDSFTNMTSLGTTVNVWENSSLSYNQIVEQVENFINETIN